MDKVLRRVSLYLGGNIKPMLDGSEQHRPPIVQIAGPFYVGILLNWFLYGILVVQVYIYWTVFGKTDRFLSKSLVLFLFIADTFQSILLANDGFLLFATNFMNPAALNETHLIWLSVPMLTGVVSCVVEIFFAYRIYLLSDKSLFAPALIVISSLVQGVAAIMAGSKNLQYRLYSLLQSKARVEIMTWHIGSTVCDVLIAVFMSYYLWKADTGIRRTHQIIVRLITLTIETGIATATIGIVDLVLFLAAPGKVYFVVPAFVAAKLYANTVVVIFNNRASIVLTDHNRESTSNHTRRPNPSRTTGDVHFVNPEASVYSHHDRVAIQKSIVVWDDTNSKVGNDLELSTRMKSSTDLTST
ncbi:hypothetical protein D9619_008617 [Psilocybe cf. subviscida]|uniref:DUF6534 domain-containing protein n=1 Tax=Psilocybe cf. subviscida TaxID=2480587 RepID=A0A8H5F0U6_9AGAR|nr:hypothetical protein D9619_008617 [Psilocybe cf. subviscida]